MRHQFWRKLFVLVASTALAAASQAASVADFEVFSHPSVPGRLYVPPEASGGPRPLILFLHGAGETGANNSAQVNGNIDNLLAAAKDRGAFLYAPQATTFTWADVGRTSTVMAMIDQAIADYNVDADRLYVTGLSMGGGGVWNMLNRHSDRFAAGAPIAAVSPGGDFAPGNLVGKPTWAFHARNDTTVSSSTSRSVVNQITAAAGLDALSFPATNDGQQTFLYAHQELDLNFSETPTGGHGIWGPVYGTPAVHDWLFSQTLGGPVVSNPAPNAQVHVSTDPRIFPFGDAAGVALDSGFAAVGAFDLPDGVIAAANASTLAELAAGFTQLGPTLPLSINSVGGLLNASSAAGLTTDDALLGKHVYLVVGNGAGIQSSSSLAVIKSDQVFAPVSQGAIELTIQQAISGGPLLDGQLLLGTLGAVDINLRGSPFDGVIAADVTVPEPAAAWLAIVVLLGLLMSTARSDGHVQFEKTVLACR